MTDPMETIADWSTIRAGDRIYENHGGRSLLVTVLTTPRRSADGDWTFEAMDGAGHRITYQMTEGEEAYRPHLSRRAQGAYVITVAPNGRRV